MIQPPLPLTIKHLQARGAEVPTPLLRQGFVPTFVLEFVGEVCFGVVDHADHVVEVGEGGAPIVEDEGFRAAWDVIAEGVGEARSGDGACGEGETDVGSVCCCGLMGVGAGIDVALTLRGTRNALRNLCFGVARYSQWCCKVYWAESSLLRASSTIGIQR